MYKMVDFLIRFRRTVIVVMSLITIFFITQIVHMQMFTQFLDLFPKDHPYVKVHKEYAKYFGGAYQATLMLEVKEGDVLNAETLSKMYRLQYDVDLISGVDHFGIYSIASPLVTFTKETPFGYATKQIMKDVPNNQAELEDLKRKVFTSPINGTLVSRDQKALLLNANFIEGRIDFLKVFKEFMKLKKREEDANHKIYISGTPLVYGWIYYHLWNPPWKSMGAILIGSTLIILAMLYLYMNQGGLWWWPFIGAVLCSVWGLGFSAWMGFHFDPLIIVIPFLLSARAMSHGVQWVERFTEEYARLGDTRQAALITGAGLFPPGLIGIIADTWALLIIAITPIPTLRNLAFIGTFWAGACIFTVLVLFPPLFSMFKKVKIPRKSDVPRTIGYRMEYFTEHLLRKTLVKMSSWTFGKGRYITVGLSIAVLIVAVHSSRALKFGDANPGDPILWQDSPYNTAVKKINSRFPGMDQMWVVVEGKVPYAVTTPEVVRTLDVLKHYMLEDSNIGFATSIADYIKLINMLARGNDPKMEFLPRDQIPIMDLFTLIAKGSSTTELDPWINPTWSSGNVRFYLKNHEGNLLKEVIEKVEDFVKENSKALKESTIRPAGGLGGILAAANEMIKTRNDPVLLFILTVIFIHCSVTYWSILAGVIFTISLILANFLAFTYLVYKDIGLNINTFPVVSLGIGMGVDYGLYIVSRIIEIYKLQEVKDLGEAVKGGMVTAGRAVFFTATMMTAGVIFWWFSPLRFQAEMGLLLGVLMMVNMVVGVLVLPAVINIIRPRFITNPRW
jgi:uncharacterized protein